MRRHPGLSKLIFPAAFASLIANNSVLRAFEMRPSQLRLIQISPQEAHWMNLEQMRHLSFIQHQLNRCGGFFDITDQSTSRPLSAISRAKSAFDLKLASRELKQSAWIEPLINEVQPKLIEEAVLHLSQNFPNRFYDSPYGLDSAQWILNRFRELAKNRADISTEIVKHKFKQFSIIVRIAGTQFPDERIILGAHQDSVNWEDTGPLASLPAPGADDDASGVAVLLEVFRLLAQSPYRPARTIEFMAYAGEELGLLGSQAIAERYSTERKKVGAVLQFDMTGFPGSGSNRITLIKDFTHAPLTDFVRKLVTTYLKVQSQDDKCGYGCSDHASWNRYGFPAAFPFEAGQDNHLTEIHTTRDTVKDAKLDFNFASLFAKLGLAYAIELSRD